MILSILFSLIFGNFSSFAFDQEQIVERYEPCTWQDIANQEQISLTCEKLTLYSSETFSDLSEEKTDVVLNHSLILSYLKEMDSTVRRLTFVDHKNGLLIFLTVLANTEEIKAYKARSLVKNYKTNMWKISIFAFKKGFNSVRDLVQYCGPNKTLLECSFHHKDSSKSPYNFARVPGSGFVLPPPGMGPSKENGIDFIYHYGYNKNAYFTDFLRGPDSRMKTASYFFDKTINQSLSEVVRIRQGLSK